LGNRGVVEGDAWSSPRTDKNALAGTEDYALRYTRGTVGLFGGRVWDYFLDIVTPAYRPGLVRRAIASSEQWGGRDDSCKTASVSSLLSLFENVEQAG
jgi:hypothetical protein